MIYKFVYDFVFSVVLTGLLGMVVLPVGLVFAGLVVFGFCVGGVIV